MTIERIFSDFFFMSTDEGAAPMLALTCYRLGWLAATALQDKVPSARA